MATEITSSSSCQGNAKSLPFIEEITRNCDQVQEQVLEEILSKNAATEYLTKYNLAGATDRRSFKSKIPLITYEDIKPEIHRIANGDRSPVLTTSPVSEFFTSSGTSGGERKLMPSTAEEMERRQNVYNLIDSVMKLYVPDMDTGKGLYFLFVKAETKTPGGLTARPILTSYYKSEQFKLLQNGYTSPIEAVLCHDTYQSMYVQMLCGLLMRHEVLRAGAVFASGFLRSIRLLQLEWKQLTSDISSGVLNPNINDPSLRECMSKILTKPDASLAESIAEECSKENWAGIIRRIWPRTRYLDLIITGSMAQYIPTLDYYSNNLPIASTLYASSECFFGLNLTPLCKPSDVCYCILPNAGYFEFLPLESASQRVLDLAEVEIGKEYEVVVTNFCGLYRYRVGDVLRVARFHNSTPLFKFVGRKNVVLSIDSDKTSEAELQEAVEKASKLLKEYGATVMEYTSYADTKTIPGHYVVYWELLKKEKQDAPPDEVMRKCCLEMEETMNAVYRQCRVSDNSIGPLEIREVESGTFEKVMDFAVSRGGSVNQYKVPRCVSVTPLIEILESRVASRHFSPSPPHWTPERSDC